MSPFPASIFRGKSVVDVCAVGISRCAWTQVFSSSGEVYVCGYGATIGCLGLAEVASVSTPTLFPLRNIHSMSYSVTSCSHTLCVTENGTLYGFGSNAYAF
jgi:alpha-tubulin suppressor-like RCC1 family protein